MDILEHAETSICADISFFLRLDRGAGGGCGGDGESRQ